MTQRAQQSYNKRPAPAEYSSAFLETELGNIQRAIPRATARTLVAHGRVAATDDLILVDATAAPVTVTLGPADRLAFLRVTIKRVNSGANAVTIAGTVDGAVDPTLGSQWATTTVQSDGTAWRSCDADDASGGAAAWRDGAGVPSNSLGADGDYYLNDTTGNVYAKASGAYTLVANIKGATGSTGSTGSPGPAGPAPSGTGYVHVTSGVLDTPSANIPNANVTGLGGAALLSVGTTTGTVAAGDDSRMTNSRTPTAHKSTHATGGSDALTASDIGADASGAASTVQTNLNTHAALTTSAHGGIVASSDARLTDARSPTAHATSHKNGGTDEIATATAGANAIPKAGSGGTLAIGWIPTGSTSSTVAIGNDSRLSDSRTPTAHAASHAAAGSDALTLSESQVTNLTSDLGLKAPLASPTFTGTPAAPTAAAGTNTTQLATTAFVQGAVGAPMVNQIPTSDVTVPVDYSFVVANAYQLNANINLVLQAGADMRII